MVHMRPNALYPPMTFRSSFVCFIRTDLHFPLLISLFLSLLLSRMIWSIPFTCMHRVSSSPSSSLPPPLLGRKLALHQKEYTGVCPLQQPNVLGLKQRSAIMYIPIVSHPLASGLFALLTRIALAPARLTSSPVQGLLAR
jgi:hypothetical protein